MCALNYLCCFVCVFDCWLFGVYVCLFLCLCCVSVVAQLFMVCRASACLCLFNCVSAACVCV